MYGFNNAKNFHWLSGWSPGRQVERSCLPEVSRHSNGRPNDGTAANVEDGDSGELQEIGTESIREVQTYSSKDALVEENTIFQAVSAPVAKGTAAVVETLVSTDDVARSILTPFHKWVMSRRRIQAALKAEQEPAATTSEYNLFWSKSLGLKLLPQVMVDIYDTLSSATKIPAELTASAKKIVEDVSVAPKQVQQVLQDAGTLVKEVVETISTVPDIAQETAEAALELRSQMIRVLENGMEAYESCRELAQTIPHKAQRLVDGTAIELKKLSIVSETLPSR